jgi:hypothetical protein
MKAYEGVDLLFLSFFTSSIDGGDEYQVLVDYQSYPRGGLVGLGGSGRFGVEKNFLAFPAGEKPISRNFK